MGISVSKRDKQHILEQERNAKRWFLERKLFREKCQILLLGTADSGKTTTLKQMKIIYGGSFTNDELLEYTSSIYRNVAESAHTIVVYMKRNGVECKEFRNRLRMDRILEFTTGSYSYSDPHISTAFADAIHHFVRDPIVSELLEDRTNRFYLIDSAEYFLSDILRISAPGYIPTESDVLRVRQKTVGITETDVTVKDIPIHFIDVSGQRTERRKWLQCFDQISSIIFCVGLSDYDRLYISEDSSQDPMIESLALFKSITESHWFYHTPVMLFLNKVDLFRTKLPKVPLTNTFEDYTGGNDVQKAISFILSKFRQTSKTQRDFSQSQPLYTHVTNAIDSENMQTTLKLYDHYDRVFFPSEEAPTVMLL
ncbi:hypothetical protein D9756_005169 [Leucocoprinus leucothites]|uniref:Uncharacterized protein n=1 Tax=Leucocoprinus leucothites TaxID=201217 RepID=A0A8H5G9Y4_9AGAR|nr:hypothetical protein D9756_005169 [Leucoagaricus leucothites]